MSNPIIDQKRTKRWFNEDQLLHRIDGPALENEIDGYKFWFQNGEPHRLDGPAKEFSSGSKFWYQNGLRHRTDGPAVEEANGYKEFWINGKKLTKQEFMTKTQNLNIETEEIL